MLPAVYSPRSGRIKKEETVYGFLFFAYDMKLYSASRISRILIAAVEIGVPGPKIAAAPSR